MESILGGSQFPDVGRLTLSGPKGEKFASVLLVNMIANRESICDVALSSTRQHNELVDASTGKHDEQLSDQLVVALLC